MTVDLFLNTKLLSLGKPEKKGRPAASDPWGASLWLKVSIIPGIWASCLQQTNVHYLQIYLQLLLYNSARRRDSGGDGGLMDSYHEIKGKMSNLEKNNPSNSFSVLTCTEIYYKSCSQRDTSPDCICSVSSKRKQQEFKRLGTSKSKELLWASRETKHSPNHD